MLGLLGVEINERDFKILYSEFMNRENKFSIMKLVKNVMKHTEIYRSLMFNVMMVNNFSFMQLFEEIKSDSTKNYWTIKEFEFLNSEFIGITDAEC